MKKKVVIGIMIILAVASLLFGYQSYRYYQLYHNAMIEKDNERIKENISKDTTSKENSIKEEMPSEDTDGRRVSDIKNVTEDFIDTFMEYSTNPYERYMALEKYMTEDAIRDFYKLDENGMSLEELEKMLQETSQAEEIGDIVVRSEILSMRAIVELSENKTSASVMVNGKKHMYNDEIELDNITDFLFDADVILENDQWFIEKIYEIK